MADIDHVVELFDKLPEAERLRRYERGRLQIDLAQAEAKFTAAAESLAEHLERIGLHNLSVGTRTRLESVLGAMKERNALSRTIANQADEPKESGAW